MSELSKQQTLQDIVIEEIVPHAPSTIWQALSSGELMNRWLMPQTGFEAVKGTHFTLHTKADGDWDGVIHCEVLQAEPNACLSYTWKSGVDTAAGYISRLDTVVTWTLSHHDLGTRLRIVHSGFVLPKNESVFKNVNAGWSVVLPRMIEIAAEEAKRKEGMAA